MNIKVKCCADCLLYCCDDEGNAFCRHPKGPNDDFKNDNKIHNDCPLLKSSITIEIG